MHPIEVIIKMQTMSDLIHSSISNEDKKELVTIICNKVVNHNYAGILQEIEKRELNDIVRKILVRSAKDFEYAAFIDFFDDFLLQKSEGNANLKLHIEELSKNF